jgi:WD40 repeat protein
VASRIFCADIRSQNPLTVDSIADLPGGTQDVVLTPGNDLVSVAFSPDGQFLAYGSSSGQVVLRPVQGGFRVRTPGCEGEAAFDLAFSPDGQLLACACGETLELWQVADGSSLYPFWGHEGRVLSVAFSPDGRILASSGDDRSIRLWRVSDGRLLRILSGHTAAGITWPFPLTGRCSPRARGMEQFGCGGCARGGGPGNNVRGIEDAQ